MAIKLQPGVTAIGEVNGKDSNNFIRKFTILYGNVADPVINGEVMHLKADLYKKMLMKFLDSEEGKIYEIPSDEEIEQASIDMLNKEEAAKQLERQKEEEEAKLLEQQIEEEKEKTQKLEINNSETKEEEVAKKPKTNVLTKVIIGLLSGLLLLSVIGNVVQLVSKTGNGPEYIELSVDDETFKIPSEQLEVSSGESKIIIYGIGRTSDGHNVKTKVIPLGEFNIDKASKAMSDETEEKVQEETTEEEIPEANSSEDNEN